MLRVIGSKLLGFSNTKSAYCASRIDELAERSFCSLCFRHTFYCIRMRADASRCTYTESNEAPPTFLRIRQY